MGSIKLWMDGRKCTLSLFLKVNCRVYRTETEFGTKNLLCKKKVGCFEQSKLLVRTECITFRWLVNRRVVVLQRCAMSALFHKVSKCTRCIGFFVPKREGCRSYCSQWSLKGPFECTLASTSTCTFDWNIPADGLVKVLRLVPFGEKSV